MICGNTILFKVARLAGSLIVQSHKEKAYHRGYFLKRRAQRFRQKKLHKIGSMQLEGGFGGIQDRFDLIILRDKNSLTTN
jgi:hypothetical protein